MLRWEVLIHNSKKTSAEMSELNWIQVSSTSLEKCGHKEWHTNFSLFFLSRQWPTFVNIIVGTLSQGIQGTKH